ncbi:MAG: hypothetical protein CVU20_03235 [Betaproteobacteria bacterium HGW-Betaproteobacteria-14]|nr:MAG: hypothetical protein CVU20_03235 [Betaproteobacteria bacterium HGW-Betaproteobacteria-14]
MRRAGEEIRECYRVLEMGGLNVVGEILRGQGAFVEFDHYPADDVFDADSHAQYYYHAHRGAAGEHGHFHTFLRAPGMPAGVAPVPYAGAEPWPAGEAALSHLVAIAMDDYGYPSGLFTVNRWVTGDAWYAAGDVIRMLDFFAIDHANPSWPANRWITAMLRLFRPQIEALILARDAALAEWVRAHPGVDVFEDRALEIASQAAISVEEQIAAVEAALKGDTS